EDIAVGMRRTATARLDRAVSSLGRADALDQGIHDARKQLKQIRAVLRLLRNELPITIFESENSAFGDMGRSLSASRDAAVMRSTLAAVLGRSDDSHTVGIEKWDQLLGEPDGHVPTDSTEAAKRVILQLADARLRIQGWPLRRCDWRKLQKGLAR